jgi:hypothetical protein
MTALWPCENRPKVKTRQIRGAWSGGKKLDPAFSSCGCDLQGAFSARVFYGVVNHMANKLSLNGISISPVLTCKIQVIEKTLAMPILICYLKWIFYHTRRRIWCPVLSSESRQQAKRRRRKNQLMKGERKWLTLR